MKIFLAMDAVSIPLKELDTNAWIVTNLTFAKFVNRRLIMNMIYWRWKNLKLKKNNMIINWWKNSWKLGESLSNTVQDPVVQAVHRSKNQEKNTNHIKKITKNIKNKTVKSKKEELKKWLRLLEVNFLNTKVSLNVQWKCQWKKPLPSMQRKTIWRFLRIDKTKETRKEWENWHYSSTKTKKNFQKLWNKTLTKTLDNYSRC